MGVIPPTKPHQLARGGTGLVPEGCVPMPPALRLLAARGGRVMKEHELRLQVPS